MIGKLIGKALAAPVRLVNIPLKAVDKLIQADEWNGGDTFAWPLRKVAEAIEETGKEIDR